MSGKIVAPASAARYTLRMWILFRGVSRTTERERTFFFQAHVGSSFDQVGSRTLGDVDRVPTLQGNHHGIGGIGTAGYVGADIVIRLLLDFRPLAPVVAMAMLCGERGKVSPNRRQAQLQTSLAVRLLQGKFLSIGSHKRRVKMKASWERKTRRAAAQIRALAEVRRHIRPCDSASGRKYLREFTQAFRDYDRVLSLDELSAKIAAADILLIGDYHALPKSQRFAADIFEQLAQTRRVALGVEAILSRDQPILDSWWRREIDEPELRTRLRFDREWGYEWTPFYELLTTAREHGEDILGLDCMPRHDLRRIRSRDRHAAAKIAELRERNPQAAILVLFGESHMAPSHLPAVLRKAMPEEPILTVVQNVDALYWRAVNEAVPAVKIGEDAVCVFNSSPLEKYESYRLCLERWHGNTDELPDFAPAVYNLIFSLALSLGFRLQSPHNSSQPRYLADSLPEVVSLTDAKSDFNPRSSTVSTAVQHGESRRSYESVLPSRAVERLEERGCTYLPATNTFVVREFRIPSAAAEAARFLHYACRGARAIDASSRNQLEDALAHFGLRLLCPEAQEESSNNELGESIYQAYVEGRITKVTLRKMFSSELDEGAGTID